MNKNNNHDNKEKKACYHIVNGNPGDVPFYRYFTGNSVEYYLVCYECLNNKQTFYENLREISEDVFSKHDNYLFSCTGYRGYPQIRSREENLKFEHTKVKLIRGVGERILDYQPLNNALNCEVIALIESFRFIKIDLQSQDYIELCRVSEKTQIDLQKEVSMILSAKGDFCAVFNLKGQFGAVIDIFTGKILMQLDRGNYHFAASNFPIVFVDWKGKTLVIHGTAWNKLNISDPLSGKILTKREIDINPQIYSDTKSNHYSDYFHAAITVSDNFEWIVDNGWVWHPVGKVVTWNIKKWLEDNIWESEDGSSKKTLCSRVYYWDGAICWIDEKRVAVFGFGDDEDWILPAVRVFDVTNGEELYWFAGPDNRLVYDMYLFSSSTDNGVKVWDIDTGELLLTDGSFYPLMYHKRSKIFISVISNEEYILSRLTDK